MRLRKLPTLEAILLVCNFLQTTLAGRTSSISVGGGNSGVSIASSNGLEKEPTSSQHSSHRQYTHTLDTGGGSVSYGSSGNKASSNPNVNLVAASSSIGSGGGGDNGGRGGGGGAYGGTAGGESGSIRNSYHDSSSKAFPSGSGSLDYGGSSEGAYQNAFSLGHSSSSSSSSGYIPPASSGYPPSGGGYPPPSSSSYQPSPSSGYPSPTYPLPPSSPTAASSSSSAAIPVVDTSHPHGPAYTYYYQHYPTGATGATGGWGVEGHEGEGDFGGGFGGLGGVGGGIGGLAALKGIGIVAAIAKGIIALKPFLVIGLLFLIAVPILLLFLPIPIITVTGSPNMTSGTTPPGRRSNDPSVMSYFSQLSERVLNSEECLERFICKMPKAPESYRKKAKELWDAWGAPYIRNERVSRGVGAYFDTEKNKNLKCNQRFKCTNKFI